MSYFLLYPCAALGLVILMLTLMGVKVSRRWLKLVVAAGLAQVALRICFFTKLATWGIDYRIFRNVGLDVLAGLDPYDPARFQAHPFLNPPPTFPFFAVLALLPERPGQMIWTIVNSILAVLIVPLALKVVRRDSSEGVWEGRPLLELAPIVVVFALSDACTACIDVGQLPLLATFVVLLALAFRGERPILAGVCLAFATMKINTMLPFLLLFPSRRDRVTWAAFAATVVALLLATGHPERLIGQCQAMLHHVGELARPGQINDIGYDGITNESIIGFDHALYRLGVHDRGACRAGQAVLLLTLGGWLVWSLWTGRLAGGRAVAVVSLFSVLFLYHRLYDTVIFAPALVLAFGQSRWTRGRFRHLSIAALVLILSVLYMRRGPMSNLTRLTLGWGTAGALVQAVVLPYATWAILLAMVCLVRAGRSEVSVADGREASSSLGFPELR